MLFFTASSLGNLLSNSSSAAFAALGAKLLAGGQAFSSLHGTTDGNAIIATSFMRRMEAPGTWLTLTFMLVLIWGMCSSDVKKEEIIPSGHKELKEQNPRIKAEYFVLFLVLVGVGLTLFPEYFYLRDDFGTRMNTIFKFYFQTWMFWGIAAAFGTVVLWSELKRWKHTLFSIGWIVIILAALVYPCAMLINKTNSLRPTQWTLDGNAYFKLFHPDDALAINWLKEQPMNIVSEAVGGSYTEYARVSEQTGFPTVIGWPGHESQWRGGATEMGSRQQDIKTLYETDDWLKAETIIAEYNIHYIFVGYLENTTYKVSLSKFNTNLKVVYQNQTVTIYQVPDEVKG
jgi:uncharacterized membrane protein